MQGCFLPIWLMPGIWLRVSYFRFLSALFITWLINQKFCRTPVTNVSSQSLVLMLLKSFLHSSACPASKTPTWTFTFTAGRHHSNYFKMAGIITHDMYSPGFQLERHFPSSLSSLLILLSLLRICRLPVSLCTLLQREVAQPLPKQAVLV